MTGAASTASPTPWSAWLRPALPPILLLLLALLLSWSPLDVALQHWFHDPAAGWLVDAKAPWSRRLFYDGPKVALVILGVVLSLLLLLGFWRRGLRGIRRELVFLLLCLALVPTAANRLKQVTDVYCPSQTTEFGGRYRHVPPFGFHPEAKRSPGRCFPAGHASGGFALLSLGWLSGQRAWRIAGVGLGLAAGSVMAAYQMAKGAHFLSHSLATLALAWLMIAMLASWFGLPCREEPPP
ncbi:phosphatase PAP2 family protein [Geminicoccus flavidas]|uniref:phosphatase PAP2 family protein n=1 Tax=Geminicoccus flavidas TaxID=2506407 RepID=UPI001357A953|nr:phosphatase PAP2 family protein [Geminicoccus flavidas]